MLRPIYPAPSDDIYTVRWARISTYTRVVGGLAASTSLHEQKYTLDMNVTHYTSPHIILSHTQYPVGIHFSLYVTDLYL